MNHLILAIDQGTGGTKTVLFETDGGVVAKAAVPLQSHYPQVGFVEQDPGELYENVLASVRRFHAGAPRTRCPATPIGSR